MVAEKVAARFAREIGSVPMPVIFPSAVAGPITRAIRGSTLTSTTCEPEATSPESAGTIGRSFSATLSSATCTSPGEIAMTSTSGGTLMSSGARR